MNTKKEHSKGLVATLLFHGALLAVLLFMAFITPLPLPGEEGILINFGTDESGFGDTEPMENDVTENSQEASESSESSEAENSEAQDELLTQNTEEAPVVENKKKENENRENVPVTDNKKDTEEKKQEERTPDERALFPGKDKNSNSNNSEGDRDGDGNQGDPDGDPDSKNREGDGQGDSGIGFSLDGRTPQSLPKPEYDYQKSGIVVVEITVNREGEVISANPGVKGSTTLDNYLLTVARKAAMKARFNRKSDAAAVQKGTITYYFKLQ